MIRKYLALALISVGLLSALPGCQGSGKDIGQEKATQIALDDAGTTEDAISRFRVSQERDDGRVIYEVQFSLDGTEYEYEISAENGDIISSSKDMDNNSQAAPTAAATPTVAVEPTAAPETANTTAPADTGTPAPEQTTQTPGTAATQLSMDDAIQLVLERIPGATAEDVRIKLDYDDGYYKYEGDVIYNQVEYDFEMDANTGNFLEWEEDRG